MAMLYIIYRLMSINLHGYNHNGTARQFASLLASFAFTCELKTGELRSREGRAAPPRRAKLVEPPPLLRRSAAIPRCARAESSRGLTSAPSALCALKRNSINTLLGLARGGYLRAGSPTISRSLKELPCRAAHVARALSSGTTR